MSELSTIAAARERPDGIAIVDADGATSWAALAAELGARARPRDTRRAIPIVGAAERERVIDVLAAIEHGVPIAMIHPRWPGPERARVHAAIERDAPLPGTLAILHTSGTTGIARGVMLPRSAFVASARASAARLPLDPTRDRWLLCMPIAHVGGLSIVVRSLIARSSISIAGAFDVERVLGAIARDRPTIVSLVPTMLAMLLDAGWERPPELRAVLLGGAACPERLLARAVERGLPIRTTYGLTEACSQVTTATSDVRSPDDGAGEPLPGIDVRIGARGTIEVRGPTMTTGHFPPDAGGPARDPDGWYDTGDVGALDPHGRLHVHARRTDLIVTGGENVYPAMVEAALERITGIDAACVFGIPDETWGQIVAAAIVTREGALEDAAIARALAASLAPFAIPRRIARVASIVAGPSGKIDRRAVAEHAQGALREIAR